MDKHGALKQYFGYTEFREGQEVIIDAIASGRDAVAVMPTGAGKSLCFQVPALMLRGITLVISPLISLMKDQVNALTQAGVPAAYINSSLSESQYFRALDNAASGAYRIIYVAPERLETEGFLRFARNSDISMVAVDEAHCVSRWGQDFRPSYLKIPAFIEKLSSRPVVSAFTATATFEVRKDIEKMLNMRDPLRIVTGFDRKNLHYEVITPKGKKKSLLEIVDKYEGKSGVIYCATRKAVEEVSAMLVQVGIPATRYHAGLPDRERRENQDDFIYDIKPVMVATNAFGMGIDKSNVSYVIHYNMPKDLESYYQEAGRAGRDGEPADCILLYGAQDVITNKFLIENSKDSEEMDGETRAQVIERDLERLKKMTQYCSTTDCLRQYILDYFGEKIADYCGNCSNCTGDFELTDITTDAQKILSCVKRTGERFGASLIADILRGANTQKILSFGLERQTTYGLMSDLTQDGIRQRINYLTDRDFLATSEGQYPVLSLGSAARSVLFEGATVTLKLKKPAYQPPKAQSTYAHPTDGGVSGERDPFFDLFEHLRKVRTELAKAQNVPSYVVMTDATLRAMCRERPTTPEALLELPGIGQKKLEQYGQIFLDAIAQF